MGVTGGPNIIRDSSLVLELDAADRNSYPGSGTTWRDLTANNNNGTLTNGPTFSSNNLGNIVFDGTNDYINISPIVNLSNVSQFTFSSFVKINSVNVKALFSYGIFGSFTNDILIFFNISPSLLYIQVNNGADGSATIPYTNLTTYANICVVYDGSLSTNADKLKLYINGSLSTLTFDALYSVPTTTANVTSAECRIGSYVATNGFFLSGNIATASIYNRALTSSEVLQNYNATKTRFGL